jgi:hypothetical protein
MEWLHRVLSGQTVSPTELRVAGLFALEWWLMDHVWMIGTLLGWW